MIEVYEGKVRVREEVGGSRGTDYYHIEIDGVLEPIRWVFRRYGRFVGSSRAGKRREYEYKIPIDELRKIGDIVRFYRFSYSNKGYGPYITIYEVNCDSLTVREMSGVSLNNLTFKIDSRDVEERIRAYQRYVPAFIDRVKDVQSKLGFDISFRRAARLEDIYNDPNNAYKIALTFSENKARAKALEAYIQSAHELYVLALVIEALNGRIISSYGSPTLYIEKGSDYPSAIVESNGKIFTVWYQFSIKRWIDVVFAGLLRMFEDSGIISELQKKAMEGEFEIFERLFGVKPKNVQEAYKLIREAGKLGQRQYIMPDVVVFEGEYYRREDIRKNPPKKALVIDAKIEMGDSDLEQLLAYKKIFDETLDGCETKYIVACLEKIFPYHKRTLEANGMKVIEDVASRTAGEETFIREIKNFFATS